MAGSNTLALTAGGLVVVALSLAAGFLGGSLASPGGGAADDAAAPPRILPDAVVRGRLDELDRRLTNVEERLRVAEDSVQGALSRVQEIDALRRALDDLRLGTGAAAGPVAPRDATAGGGQEGPAEPLSAEERELREAERIRKLKEDAAKIRERYAPAFLTQWLNRVADASEQGAADRRSQVASEAQRLAVQYSLTPDEADRVREILRTESEESVRDLAPYLGGGLERADYSSVKSRLFAIWDRRDAAMKEVLDEQELADYSENQAEARKVYGKVLDDWQAER